MERAVEWIFNHPGEVATIEDPSLGHGSSDGGRGGVAGVAPCRDGKESYRLVAFISHMGSSTMCGHYVCHILKEGRWVIFNDNKVAQSESPPKELAYLYLYQRVSSPAQ